MKVRYIYVFVVLLITLLQSSTFSQSFGAGWVCEYATWDDQPNSTSYNTVSVAAIKENTFAALVWTSTTAGVKTSYLVGYTDADSGKGRMGTFDYGSTIAGYKMSWSQGFDEVLMQDAYDLAATPDSLIYVANNDVEKNILVFKMTKDTIVTTDYRMSTGTDNIWAVDVDGNGRVYVSVTGDTLKAGKILVFKSIKEDNNWGDFHDTKPIQTINLPDAGEIRGVTANPAGTIIYVSNFTNKKIYCYVGSPTAGYTLYSGFNFTLSDPKVTSAGTTLNPGPWGLKFMKDKNILFAAASATFGTANRYEYGKIFLINPNTGAMLDTIDCAEWNYKMSGSYQSRTNGGRTPGNASGYTSTYNVDFDNNYKLYSQSYYGWTAEKWAYKATLPVVPLTITGVEKTDLTAPSKFSLEQNYPNPFNPSTTIQFSLNEESDITLSLYSITGELVTEIIKNSTFSKGTYKVTLDASNLASGTYIYTIKNKNNQLSKKMLLLK